MTMVDAGPGRSAWDEARPPPGPASPQRRRASSPAALAREAAGNALTILALFLIGFVLWFAFLSHLYYDRVQVTSYAIFRNELALATAPIGPTVPPPLTSPGAPTPPPQLLAPGTPVAVLNIPAIGLKTVVFEGTSGQVLEGGPGHVRDTPLPGQPGQSVIFGRRTAYGGPFSRLPTLHVGDYFTVTTGQGVATYRVIDVRRAHDPTPQPPTGDQGLLTLVTADGPPLAPSGVLYVDADLTSQPRAAPPMVLTRSDLGPSEQVLGTDAQAWVPVVLWGTLLLAVSGLLAWTGRQWGRWQTWIVAVPVLCFLTLVISDQVALLLPNIM